MNDSRAPLSQAGQSDVRHHLHPYTQLRQLEETGPLVIVRGEGVQVFDENGKAYIEAMAGLWCASLGFSEKRLVDAAQRQMATLPFYHSFSGKVPGPVPALVEAVLAVARYAAANLETLAELDVNPIIVRPSGHGVVAVDALVRIAEKA